MILSEEQRAVRDLARDVFAKEAASERLAELVAQTGLLEVDDASFSLVLEEAGYFAVPDELLEHRLDMAGAAALLNGVSRRLLDLSVDHVRAREQFGRPVGSFQAVQHKLASVHVLLEQARAAAWHAAQRPGDVVSASVAKLLANDAARLANTEALQCHGGVGFTWEHELHRWLKRGLALEVAYGTTREHRAALAAALLDEETA